ncbi:MAG: RecX family transcriptional regulator [Anaerolineales bacterium]
MANTVTAIKQQKRNPARVNIYLDGVYAFPLAKIVAAWLKVGQELPPEKIDELKGMDGIEAAYQKALNFLSYRPRSETEVERNLRKHAVAEEVIVGVIERLRTAKLLDDSEFARTWVENRSAFRPRGSYALRAELRQKGLSDEAIEQSLNGLPEGELAQQAADRKARQLKDLDWPTFRNKLSAHLSRRGFGYVLVSEACQAAWQTLHQEDPQKIYEQRGRIKHGR